MMTTALTRLEAARQAYLLLLCHRTALGPMVSRGYLEEKVRQLYRCTTPEEVRSMLDVGSLRTFDLVFSPSAQPAHAVCSHCHQPC